MTVPLAFTLDAFAGYFAAGGSPVAKAALAHRRRACLADAGGGGYPLR
jgi:hypothetical protein